MQDLYATTFAVSSDDPGAALGQIAKQVLAWAWRGEGPPPTLEKPTGERTEEGYSLRWASFSSEGGEDRAAISVQLLHRDARDPGIQWQSLADLSRQGPELRVTLRIVREATEFRLAPAHLTLRRPGIVPQLFEEHQCRAGGIDLSSSAMTVGVTDVDAFAVDVLRSPNRTLPVIVVSAPSGREHPYVHPDRAADELAGLAHVFTLGGFMAWERLRENVGPGNFVPPGGIRIYWPGFGQPGDTVRHRYWLRRHILATQEPFARVLFHMLSRMSVVRVPRDNTIRALQSEALQARAERARSADEQSELVEALEELLAEREGELADTQSQVQALEEVNAELEEDLERQRAAWAQVQAAEAGGTDGARNDSGQALADTPTDWEEFDILVDDLEGDGFRLTTRAREQCADNSYPDPARMWDHLRRLSEAGAEYHRRDAAVGNRLEDWLQAEYGLDISLFDGDLRDTGFEFEGSAYSREPHVKVDDYVKPDECGRIYFAVDGADSRFIVDHIGLHL